MDGKWTFLTNHAHVLVVVAASPDARIRDIADRVGITQRAVQRILSDLHSEGYIEVHKEGRRNHYEVLRSGQLRHPIEQHATVGDLLALLDNLSPA